MTESKKPEADVTTSCISCKFEHGLPDELSSGIITFAVGLFPQGEREREVTDALGNGVTVAQQTLDLLV